MENVLLKRAIQWIIFWVIYPIIYVWVIILWFSILWFHTTEKGNRLWAICYTDNFCVQKKVEVPMANTYVDTFVKSQRILQERWFSIWEDYARFWQSNRMIFNYKKKWEKDISVDLITEDVIVWKVNNDF